MKSEEIDKAVEVERDEVADGERTVHGESISQCQPSSSQQYSYGATHLFVVLPVRRRRRDQRATEDDEGVEGELVAPPPLSSPHEPAAPDSCPSTPASTVRASPRGMLTSLYS